MAQSKPSSICRPNPGDLSLRRALVASMAFAGSLLLAPQVVSSQVISLRTVPLARGNQFDIAPASRRGMSGTTLAIADTEADPFRNPALGNGVSESRFMLLPSTYGVRWSRRGARTLPFATLLTGNDWFGGGSLALQQVLRDSDRIPRPWMVDEWFVSDPPLLSERSATNHLASFYIGRRFSQQTWAWGVGMDVANVNAADGVDLLYQGSSRIDQSGGTLSLKTGLHGTLSGNQQVELSAIYSQFRMEHEVTWQNWIRSDDWGLTRPALPAVRVEKNLDRTTTLGGAIRYTRAVEGTGWTLGGLVSGNYKDHPKIPNYQIMNIPRDPGTSWAWNVGLGVARHWETSVFALDVVLEPAWSETWADAESPITRFDGSVVQKGERTIQNNFSFLNTAFRAGAQHTEGPIRLQVGIAAHSYSYDLRQLDRIEVTIRDQEESWIEWSPTWGLGVKVGGTFLEYSGSALLGAGTPGVSSDRAFAAGGDNMESDILAAPSGPLTLEETRLLTHRLSLSIPIR